MNRSRIARRNARRTSCTPAISPASKRVDPVGFANSCAARGRWFATLSTEKIDIPPIPEFIELVADSGAHLYACKATVDMFDLTMNDFVPQVGEIISVGEFYEKAAGGQIIFI